MRRWHTCGAFGDQVFELTVWEWFAVLFGKEFRHSSVVISVGKSKVECAPNNYAGSREDQLNAQEARARMRA